MTDPADKLAGTFACPLYRGCTLSRRACLLRQETKEKVRHVKGEVYRRPARLALCDPATCAEGRRTRELVTPAQLVAEVEAHKARARAHTAGLGRRRRKTAPPAASAAVAPAAPRPVASRGRRRLTIAKSESKETTVNPTCNAPGCTTRVIASSPYAKEGRCRLHPPRGMAPAAPRDTSRKTSRATAAPPQDLATLTDDELLALRERVDAEGTRRLSARSKLEAKFSRPDAA